MAMFNLFPQTARLDKMALKLEFNTDFTYFLENNEFHDPVLVVTESESMKCSAVLLAQHSSVLREFIKEDNELFITHNKHVRECLSVLYGGEVKLTEENFLDILKFMVTFDVPLAIQQILDWISKTMSTWNLDNASVLLNGSMVAVKASTKAKILKASLREDIYKPCRLFLGEHLLKLIRTDSSDVRYKDLESAGESVISGVDDREELLTLLLHQDLIPDYIPWVKMLLNQSSYHIFLDCLDKPEISNKMSLCSRTQSEELFDKIEDFENVTLKEYKHLIKYKMKINDKITTLLSLRFMKEGGNLYSSWKNLDADGMTIFSTAFTDKSDQFCVIESLISWISVNKPSLNSDMAGRVLSKAIHHLLQGTETISLSRYRSYLDKVFSELQTVSPQFTLSLPTIPATKDLYHVEGVITKVAQVQSDFIWTWTVQNMINQQVGVAQTMTQMRVGQTMRVGLTFTIKLSPKNIPEVRCDEPNGQLQNSYHLYVYAWKNDGIRIPLYSELSEAYKIIKQFSDYYIGASRHYGNYGNYIIPDKDNNILLAMLGIGVS